ncbi:hypothetical protein NQ317_004265 [Molorchus minor]|uniref:SCP domain-containing protein n=1 Tax=Molorchus minor TaxID=1323400 RepID=A0ABQ9K0R7_9CUCU|nr:hypothetical protein NQ317_004265 [Molorchus minor]
MYSKYYFTMDTESANRYRQKICVIASTPYDTPLTEPSTSFGQTTTSRRGLLHGMGIFKTSELTPKAKRMYRQAIYYKRRAHALNRKNFKEKQFSNYIKECIEQSKRRELIIEEDYNCEATEADRLHIHWISNAKTIGTGCVIICGRKMGFVVAVKAK